MKKIIISSICLSIIILIGCLKRNNDKTEQTSLQSKKTVSKEVLSLNFYNSTQANSNNFSPAANIYFTIDEYSNNSFDSIASIITSSVSNLDRSTISKIILYGNDSSSVNHSYNSFSIITKTTSGVFFRHYIKVNSVYQLFQDSVIKFSTYADRDLIALFQKDSNFLNYSHPTIEILKKQSISSSGTNYNKTLSASLIDMNLEYVPYADEKPCKGCGGGKSGSCLTNETTNEKYCSDGRDCLVLTINSDGVVANTDSIYTFRDSVLQKYSLGQKYRAYYEYISFIINSFERPNTISLSEQVDFLLSTLNAAYAFQYGQDSEIIITSSYQTKANSFIQKYKSYIPNLSFGNVLDDISQDLSFYYNKTKGIIKPGL